MSNKYHEIDMSICTQDPQFILSRALEEKNMRDFKLALDMEADPTRMDEETNISLFEMALQTPGCAEFVEECIRRGCKCDYTNRRLNRRPINFATDSKDPQILSKILKVKNLQIDLKYANLTPLNSLAKNITIENFDDVFGCIKLLVDYGANPNIPDQREMTPILHILNNKKLDNDRKKILIKYLLDNAQCDLDTFRDGEARERIKSRFPDISLPLENTTGQINHEILLTLLRNGSENRFINAFNEYQLSLQASDRDNQQNCAQENNLLLLFEAIKKGLMDAFNIILKTDININLIINSNSAIEIACIWGNWKALQILLDLDEIKLRKYENLLITIIKKLDEQTYDDFCDYQKCFHILLESPKIDINEVDKSGSSPLHYAVKYRNEKAMKELLKRGAYIGTKSVFNDLPITEINPELLEEYFDSCITTNGVKSGDDHFEIIINYKNLIPSSGFGQKQSQQNMMFNVNEEMLPIEHIAETKELKHLLKHPLITSFLFLKWHRLAPLFYINLFLYTIFCISLVTYIVLHFRDTADEGIVVLFKTIACFGLAYLIFREILQFLVSPRSHFRSPINILETILILLSILSLCEPNYEKEAQRVVAVFTILLASVELCLLIGSLPVTSISTHMLMLQAVSRTFLKSFTLYSIFVVTFSLCFYILFGKTEFGGNKNGNKEKSLKSSNNTDGITNDMSPDGDDDEEGDFNKFVNPFTAIIKTIVMLTGEFDAGDIDFHSFMSYFVFLLFVIFMSIVLFNLLNGLAVSDTQTIKAQAQLNSYLCRTTVLCNYEKMLMGKGGKMSFFVHHQPFRSIFKKLTNIFPNYICGNHIAILPNDSNKVLIPVSPPTNSREMYAMPAKTNGNTLLQNARDLTDYDDIDREKKLINTSLRILPCCCICWAGHCAQMDIRTVKASLSIIEKKQHVSKLRQKTEDHEIRFKKLEEKIDKIFDMLKELTLK